MCSKKVTQLTKGTSPEILWIFSVLATQGLCLSFPPYIGPSVCPSHLSHYANTNTKSNSTTCPSLVTASSQPRHSLVTVFQFLTIWKY